jgi:ribosomal protein S18 acetylase RimI-like enzyme
MAIYRPFRLEDREVATRLITDVYREALKRDVSKYVREELARFLSEFDHSRDLFLIAEEAGTMVGTVIMDHNNPSEGVCNMSFLTVMPEFRGKGHGKELVTQGMEFARLAGYKAVELTVTPEFDFALKMYERLGFKQVDTYLYQGSNVVTLERWL